MWNRRFIDHRLQYGDLGREATRHDLGGAAVKPGQRFGLEEVPPRSSPSLQLDLWTQEMLDLNDPRVEIGEVGGGARLTIFEVETDLEPTSQSIGPDLVVNAVVAIVEFEEHRVCAMAKVSELSWEIRSRVRYDRGEEIAPSQAGGAAS